MTTALLILAVVFTALLMFGVPVSFSIGIATLAGAVHRHALAQYRPDRLRTAGGVAWADFTLVAIPLFILAGGLMNTGGIAMRLIDLAKVLVGLVARLAGADARWWPMRCWCHLRLGRGQRSIGWCHAVTIPNARRATTCPSVRRPTWPLVPVWPADSAVGRADCLFADLGRHTGRRVVCCGLHPRHPDGRLGHGVAGHHRAAW